MGNFGNALKKWGEKRVQPVGPTAEGVRLSPPIGPGGMKPVAPPVGGLGLREQPPEEMTLAQWGKNYQPTLPRQGVPRPIAFQIGGPPQRPPQTTQPVNPAMEALRRKRMLGI